MRVELPTLAGLTPQDAKLKQRILGFLERVGAPGLTRTEIIQRFRLTAEKLDSLLDHLREHDGFVEWTASTGGRPSQRFRFQPSFSVRTEDGGRRCVWCQAPLPTANTSMFCNDACRHFGAERPLQLKEILERPATRNTHVLIQAVTCLVEADLLTRGYDVGRSLQQGGAGRLVVTTEDGSLFALRVVMSTATGVLDANFLASFQGAAVAVVFSTGRVVYYGLPVTDGAQKEGGPV